MKKDLKDDNYLKSVEKKRQYAVEAMNRLHKKIQNFMSRCPELFYAKTRHKGELIWLSIRCLNNASIEYQKCNKRDAQKNLINQKLGDEYTSLQNRSKHIKRCVDMCDLVMYDHIKLMWQDKWEKVKHPMVISLTINSRGYIYVYDPTFKQVRLLISPESTVYEEVID